ncbi:insulin receptor substrate 2-B-like isoform X2 [Conger conger]|uniref:insulin receptor substrate 2-B-like isoform X2 n=1 Tax=Conger conger TaxID=82655 RepID=UPI002A598DB2|nr:insulin receptor substrate 2-B-like isoform X2 [Conger conger]
MENFLNYQESSGGMLMLETQQRGIGTKTTTVTVSDTSAGEPPSPLINIGGARFHHQHSPHSPVHHPALQPRDQHHHRQPHHLPEDNLQEGAVRKRSSSSINLCQEDAAAAGHSLAADSAFAAAVCTDGVEADIWKCGYLRKQKHGHKRFFVLRGQSHAGPSRLEYYDSEKKFRNTLRSTAGAASAAVPPKRVIYMYQCFTVNKRADAKHKYLIALYTKDEYFAMVAENEQEQTDWYLALSDLMNEGKKRPVDPDELDDGYGVLTPSAGFKEVWQVNVKPKGLGQTKNLTGVYRLCLSAKSMHLVKLNSEMPCVNLQLMNIRRCGHSESFFFIEVGRSSSTGPGEIWMQVEDSVVAQNMHETILETMKALKAFAEFRPRSKSQSSGSNPMAFITTRRHLGNLPPSQTGLQRRSRTETVVGTPPTSKSGTGSSAYRFRTSSEGEGTMNRPFRSATGSLVHMGSARASLGRQEGGSGTGGRYPRAQPGPSYHMRSASLPVSHFPSTSSPVSVSSSSGHGSASDTLTRPSSSSVCGSPSDGGFNSSDEYGSSPCDFRYFRVRSNTPESLGNTPPIQEEHCLSDYMAMDRYCSPHPDERANEERPSYCQTVPSRPAGGSSLTAVQQKMTQTARLDEASSAHSSSQRPDCGSYSDAYCQAELPALPQNSRNPSKDDGYMPMMPGVVPSREADYMPMLASSSPAQPSGPLQADPQGYMMMLPPGRASPAWSAPLEGRRTQPENDEYMDMSRGGPSERCQAQCPPDSPGSPSVYFSLPRSYKAPVRQRLPGTPPALVPSPSPPPPPIPQDVPVQRPTRLSLGGQGGQAAPDPLPEPPSSPGEYINIEFRARAPNLPRGPPAEAAPHSPCRHRHSPLREDYLSLDTKAHCPRLSLVAPWNPPSYTRPTMSTQARVESCEEIGCGPAAGSESSRPPPRAEPKLVCAPPPGRRRHSSETFSSVGGAGSSTSPPALALNPTPSTTPGAPSPRLADSARWHSSASFDSVWLRMEGAASSPDPDTACVPTGMACRNGLNYIALDLRDTPTPDPPSPSVLAPPENGLYASIDFSRSDHLTTATSKAD